MAMLKNRNGANVILGLILIVTICAQRVDGASAGAANPSKMDSSSKQQYWMEYAYGISFAIPKNVKRVGITSKRELCRYANDKYAVSFSIIQTDKAENPGALSPMQVNGELRGGKLKRAGKSRKFLIRVGDGKATITDIYDAVVKEIWAVSGGKAREIYRDDRLTIGDRKNSLKVYFNVPSRVVDGVEQESWVLGLGVMQIDPEHFMVLRLEVGASQYLASHKAEQLAGKGRARGFAFFETLIDSVKVMKPADLDRLRKKMVEDGLFLGAIIDHEQVVKTLPSDRYFIIRDGKKEIGYMWVSYGGKGKEDGKSVLTLGVHSRIKSQSRLLHGGPQIGGKVYRKEFVPTSFKTVTMCNMSDDGGFDSFKTVRRTKQYGGIRSLKKLRDDSVAMHSQRDEDIISIQTQYGLNAKQPRKYKVQPGYLNALQVFDLAYFIPHDKAQTIGFYALNPMKGKVVFHLAYVEVIKDAGCRVYIQAGFDQQPSVYVYDKKGKLTSWISPAGYTIAPSTLKELQALDKKLFPRKKTR